MTWLWQQADTERHKASSARLLAEGQLLRSQDSMNHLSILLGIEAMKHYPPSNFVLNQFMRASLDMLPKPGDLLQHDGSVSQAVFSPDGKQLVTASEDRTARLWDTATGKELQRLSHDNSVNVVTFSPDGKQLATASSDNTARLWDTTTGKELQSMSHDGAVNAVAFSSDGKQFATASDDNTARLWDATTGKEVQRLSHDDAVNAVTFSPDDRQLATASDDGSAQLWKRAIGKELQVLHVGDKVSIATFGLNGKWLATENADGTVRLWDAVTGKELQRLSYDSAVNAGAFSPDGKQLATASVDNTARLWDATTGNEVQRLRHDGAVNAVAFSSDGKRIATASDDNTARLWDAATGKELQRLSHDGAVYAVTFSPDDRQLATASGGKTARLWLLQPDDLIKQLCSRLIHNMTWDEWQNYFEDEPYRKTCELLPVAPNYMEKGKQLAKEGKTAEIIKMIQQLSAVDTALKLDRYQILQKLAAPQRLQEAKELLRLPTDTMITEAIAGFNWVEQVDSSVISAKSWNLLCWKGALGGHPAQVLDACYKAVRAATAEERWEYLDSRGLARAFTGNSQGAIEDF